MSEHSDDRRKTIPKHPGQQEVRPLPKRFYIAAVAAPGKTGGFTVELDGRTAKTPKKTVLLLPTLPLARAVANEWQAQAVEIDPSRMPLTRLANTAIDGVTGRDAEVRADIVRYSGSDMLCYRAGHPDVLIGLQTAAWDPVLAWAGHRLGTTFLTTRGLMPVVQPPQTSAAYGAAIADLDAFRLTALHVMTTLTGSALLSLSVLDRHLTATAAWAAAHIDEDWQIAQWGPDAEAQVRREGRWTEMAAAARMLDLLRE